MRQPRNRRSIASASKKPRMTVPAVVKTLKITLFCSLYSPNRFVLPNNMRRTRQQLMEGKPVFADQLAINVVELSLAVLFGDFFHFGADLINCNTTAKQIRPQNQAALSQIRRN